MNFREIVQTQVKFHYQCLLKVFHMNFKICFRNLVLSEMISFEVIFKTVAQKFAICPTSLHTAAEPVVRAAVKNQVSERNDTITAFFFAANKNKDSA